MPQAVEGGHPGCGRQIGGEVPAVPAWRKDAIFLTQHEVRRDGGVCEIHQTGQQQRFGQQLEIRGAVRNVVDDVHEFFLANPVRRSADRQGRQPAAERQPQRPRSQPAGRRPHRHAQDEFGDYLVFARTPTRPAARRRDRGDRPRPGATFEFERHPAAQRVADDVGGVPAQLVELTLDVVGQRFGAQKPGAGVRSAVVAGHGRGEHLVAAGVDQLLGHRLPHPLRHQERVQQQDRLTGPEVDGLASRHARDTRVIPAVPQAWASGRPRRDKIESS